ncbi:MAG: DUF3990 domain-containing protein [Coriobacteriales bacterium]|jgi:hypothetical protein|nr:DUF3990 domain-containing protein [Coriobacteriales bacterium]
MSLDLNTVDELYHGSPERVPFPDAFFSSDNRDFGRGFYLFPSRDDAYDWALIKKRRLRTEEAFVNRYALLIQDLSIYCFSKDSESDLLSWVKYIIYSRGYRDIVAKSPFDGSNADVIVGPVANNVLAEAFDLLLTGRIPGKTLDEVLRNFLPYLEYDRLDYQICLKTKKAERALRFNGADKCY